MQGLEALAPVSAAPAPGRKTSQSPEAGSEFASELEALEARPDGDRAPADSGDAALAVAPEAGEETGQESVDSTPAEAETDLADLADLADPELPDWRIDDERPAQTARPPGDGDPPRLAALSQGRAPDRTGDAPVAKTSGAAIAAPDADVDAATPPAPGKGLPADRVPTSPTEGTPKETAAIRVDAVRTRSVSELALTAGLRASAATLAERPGTALPVAGLPGAGLTLGREVAEMNDVAAAGIRLESAPRDAPGLAIAPALQPPPGRAIRTDMDRRWRDLPLPAEAQAPQVPRTPGGGSPSAAAVAPMTAPMAPGVPFALPDGSHSIDLPAEPELLGLGPAGSSDAAGRAATPGLAAGLQTHGPGVAQQIAAQIGAQITQARAGTTEIVLDPQELGRVSLSLSSQDGAITVAIAAERPETADLIRRHMDHLSQELRQIGFAQVNVGLADHSGQGSGAESFAGGSAPGTDAADITPTDAAQTPPPVTPRHAGGGLDIRL